MILDRDLWGEPRHDFELRDPDVLAADVRSDHADDYPPPPFEPYRVTGNRACIGRLPYPPNTAIAGRVNRIAGESEREAAWSDLLHGLVKDGLWPWSSEEAAAQAAASGADKDNTPEANRHRINRLRAQEGKASSYMPDGRGFVS